jgi:hypothetical protein
MGQRGARHLAVKSQVVQLAPRFFASPRSASTIARRIQCWTDYPFGVRLRRFLVPETLYARS